MQPGTIYSHLARSGLTCAGLEGDVFAADAVVRVGVHSQTVLGPFYQPCQLNVGLLFHTYAFHCLVALETQERCPSHSVGVEETGLTGGHDTIMLSGVLCFVFCFHEMTGLLG